MTFPFYEPSSALWASAELIFQSIFSILGHHGAVKVLKTCDVLSLAALAHNVAHFYSSKFTRPEEIP